MHTGFDAERLRKEKTWKI